MRIHEILSKEQLKRIYEDITRRGILGLGALGLGGYLYNKNKEPQPQPKKPLPILPVTKAKPQPQPEPKAEQFIPMEHKEYFINMMKKSGITNNRDIANMLGQAYVETQGWTRPDENLYYTTPQRVFGVFTSRFRNPKSTEPFLRSPEKLANYVYSNKNGNGDINSGDGFKYRGRGFLHITGKGLYLEAGKALHPENPNIYVNNPDIISTDPKEAALTSIWYYKRKVGLGKSSRQVTSKVNTANLKAKERSDKTKDYEKELKKSGSKK
jgi:predicted chitinase